MTRIFFVKDEYGKFSVMCMSEHLADSVCDYYGEKIEANVPIIFDRFNQQCCMCAHHNNDMHKCHKGYKCDSDTPCADYEDLVILWGC